MRRRSRSPHHRDNRNSSRYSKSREESPGRNDSVSHTRRDAPEYETVYRDKHGRKIDKKLERIEQERAKREREEAEAQQMQWGKGIKQQQDKEELKRELEEIKSQPFARTANDESMNRKLKSELRWDDPMRDQVETKSQTKDAYKGYWPPNRYDIPPGLQWDGVDRSNGFEKKYLERKYSAKSRQLEAYKWRSEDM